jgi:hypothetical protein
MAKVGDVIVMMLESRADARVRSEGWLHSRLAYLLQLGSRWYRHSVLRTVLLESRSGYHRIRRSRSKAFHSRGLLFAEVSQSLPPISRDSSQIEMQPYIAGIQMVSERRSYATFADLEIFLEGWFLAEQFYAPVDTQHNSTAHSAALESPDAAHSCAISTPMQW